MIMALRRPHRKSRHGCLECKRRRVKCDEARPGCSNCSKRHSDCEYGSSSSLLWANEDPGAPQSARVPGSDNSQHLDSALEVSAKADSLSLINRLSNDYSTSPMPILALNLHDLELMKQWCNSTFYTMSRNESTHSVWKDAVPEEALSYPFLMHGILAFSALHLARTGSDTSKRTVYLKRAVAHQSQALSLFRGLLGDIQERSVKAMYAFASIIVVYTFGFPQTPDVQDPLTCVDDFHQVLVLTRGIQQVIRSPASFLSDDSFAPIFQIDEIRAPLLESASANIKRLQDANERCAILNSSHELEVYTATINDMEEMLSWIYGGMNSSAMAGKWAIKLPQRYLELLQDREPLALVMLAHYGVLLQLLKHRWCFEEQCIRVAKSVWAILDDQWRPLVHWAMCEILGVDYLDHVQNS